MTHMAMPGEKVYAGVASDDDDDHLDDDHRRSHLRAEDGRSLRQAAAQSSTSLLVGVGGVEFQDGSRECFTG